MLARLRKAQENNEGGFTLIELLVVMIIIGILAAIAIPAFLNQRNKARETAAKSDATNISKEIAAALVDGPLETLSIAAPSGGQQVLTMKTTVDGASYNTNVKVSQGNTATISTFTGTATAPSSNYCVTVVNSEGGSAWSAGPNGLKKGNAC